MKLNQREINEACDNYYFAALYQVENERPRWKQLRRCSADVAETSDYYLLRSYATIVAVVSKDSGDCFDVLRRVYEYTATSAQHIAKFSNGYGNGKRYMWRNIPNR